MLETQPAFTAFSSQSDERGFQMTFSNGCTISIIFGGGAYSDRGKTTAEVAAWLGEDDLTYRDGAWVKLPEGKTSVLGHQTPDQVADLIQALKNFQNF